jgi:hypothetical protein
MTQLRARRTTRAPCGKGWADRGPLLDEPAQIVVIRVEVTAAFEALIDRERDPELAALGTAVMDVIARARQYFGNCATLMRTNFGPDIVLFYAALRAAQAFRQGSIALAFRRSEPCPDILHEEATTPLPPCSDPSTAIVKLVP